jgi:hypothetical protein
VLVIFSLIERLSFLPLSLLVILLIGALVFVLSVVVAFITSQN